MDVEICTILRFNEFRFSCHYNIDIDKNLFCNSSLLYEMSLAINASPINTVLLNGLTLAPTITPQMSGTTFICTKGAAADVIVTLPSPTIPGLNYKFQLAPGAAVNQIMTFGAGAGSVRGSWRQITGALTLSALLGAAAATIGFTGTATGGDNIEVISDGTTYLCKGWSGVGAGIAFA
jgi:hypothetical protein